MKKQVMSSTKRKMWLIVRWLFAAAAAVILTALSCNSSITVESNGKVYTQNISPFEKSASYENSALFQEIIQEEVRSLTRTAVIRSQLETKGAYDGQRRIDICSYAHRQEDVPAATAKVEFLLDDLVKWGNYGFVAQSVYATEEELNSYFANGSSVFSIQNELAAGDWKKQSAQTRAMLKTLAAGQNEETLSARMISELPQSREEYREMAEKLGKQVQDEEIVELSILVPRYLSAQGKDLAEYATDLTSYAQLYADLKTTAKELFYNFTEYSENKGGYALQASNIRYCFRMNVDGELGYVTNLEEEFDGQSTEEITRRFAQFGSHLYYNADRSEIATNTGLTADYMKQELGYYQYAFGENTRVWLAVDTAYPANDGLRQAKEAYDSLMPYYGYLAVAFVLLAVLSILIFVHLIRYEGRVADAEGGYRIALCRQDHLFTEVFALLGAVLIGLVGVVCWGGYRICMHNWEQVGHSVWFPYAVGIAVLAADVVVMYVSLGFVRRGKAHTLWKNALLRLLLRKAADGVLSLYDNSHILVRTLVPFIGILVLNLVLGGLGVAGILAAAALDVAAILILYQRKKALYQIVLCARQIGAGDFARKVDSSKMHGENRELAEAVNGIGDGIKTAVEKSMKDERLKADLITNVSHDIKTPLTSIINFVNLLKREKIEDPRILGYINVLDQKSQRLKQLTDDLVEASKITSGNISLQMERINFAELVNQTCGEFADRLKEKCLETVVSLPDAPVYIEADPRRLWRVVENLFSNVCKYALEGTRVYLDMKEETDNGQRTAVFSMKNISAQALNIHADELTERFIRGDISRSTEGSGLGLSIAKNLTELQKGKFDIYLDGDLFKVVLTFPGRTERCNSSDI